MTSDSLDSHIAKETGPWDSTPRGFFVSTNNEGDMAANDTQIGGNHYKATDEQLARAKCCGLPKVPEPWDFSYIRGHNNLQTGIIKYVDRYNHKRGLEDLEKAKHYLEKLIEIEKAKKPMPVKDAIAYVQNLKNQGLLSAEDAKALIDRAVVQHHPV